MSVPTTPAKVEITAKEIDAWIRKHKFPKGTPLAVRKDRARSAITRQKQKDALPLGRDLTAKVSSDSPRQVIYGRVRVGGVITFLEVRNNNQVLNMIVTVSGHEIDAVEKLFLDDCEVVFGASPDPRWSTAFKKPDGTLVAAGHKVFMTSALGADNQQAIPEAIAQTAGTWTAQHRQAGCAHVFIQIKWDAALFGDGIPDCTFVVRGKKVLDPRTGLTVWSQNTALVIADYLTNQRFGMGIPWARIDTASLIAAANDCDLPGGELPAFCVDTHFTMDGTHGEILEAMAAAMAGTITYVQGQWKFWPGKWRAPVLTLGEDDVRGPVRIKTIVSKKDIFNVVRGKFIDSANGYIETSYPDIKNSLYQSWDGEELVKEINFPMTVNSATCQRLGKIELERVRQGIEVEFYASLKAYQLQVGETVNLQLPRYGWTPKTFEVHEMSLELQNNDDGPHLVVALTLRESAAGVYSWHNGEETPNDVAPNTNLPSPYFAPTLQNLRVESGTNWLYLRGDGTVAVRMAVLWDALQDFFVTSGGEIRIEFKEHSSSTWRQAGSVSGENSSFLIADVQDGISYDIRAEAVNAWGFAGAWAMIENHWCVGKLAAPSNVTGFAGVVQPFGISLAWNQIEDLDAAFYELRLAAAGQSWEQAALVAHVNATRYVIDLKLAGNHRFLVKAVDTSGNYSATAAEADIQIDAPSVDSLSFTLDGPDVVLSWPDGQGSFAVADYSLSYGAAFESSTFIATTKGSSIKVRAGWGGARRFWLQARDVAGNVGAPIFVDVSITLPGAVTNITPEVVQQNALLRWTAPAAGSLPIDHYNVKRGPSYAAAVLLGSWSGTFAAIVESQTGNVTYWIEAVDTAGNVGEPENVSAQILLPPDYALVINEQLLAGTCDHSTELDGAGVVLLPTNPGETWTQHFSSRSWTKIQDQIDAGFPIFVQPEASSGSWEKVYDYGEVIENTTIRASFTQRAVVGNPSLVCKLAYSTNGTSWVEQSAVTSLFGPAFRYVRVRFEVASPGLLELSAIFLRLDRAKIRESGQVTSSAAGGVQVTFNNRFLDLEDVKLSIQGTTPAIVTWDLVTDNQFNINAFRPSDGARIAGIVIGFEAVGY